MIWDRDGQDTHRYLLTKARIQLRYVVLASYMKIYIPVANYER